MFRIGDVLFDTKKLRTVFMTRLRIEFYRFTDNACHICLVIFFIYVFKNFYVLEFTFFNQEYIFVVCCFEKNFQLQVILQLHSIQFPIYFVIIQCWRFPHSDYFSAESSRRQVRENRLCHSFLTPLYTKKSRTSGIL